MTLSTEWTAMPRLLVTGRSLAGGGRAESEGFDPDAVAREQHRAVLTHVLAIESGFLPLNVEDPLTTEELDGPQCGPPERTAP